MPVDQKVGIAVLCHPPHFKYLADHLDSIKRSLGKRRYPVTVLSTQTDQQHIPIVQSIVAQSGIDNIELVATAKALTIGAGRNALLRYTNSEWLILTDADTTFSSDYFDQLENYFTKLDLQHVVALCGGIGINKTSALGLYESIMDLASLVSKLEGRKHNVFSPVFAEHDGQIADIASKMNAQFLAFDGQPTHCIQGFNQIVNRSLALSIGGYDPAMVSAEDRDMANNIRLHGGRIVFAPRCVVNHNYEFTLADIARRKFIHGFWCERVRIKYGAAPDIANPHSVQRWLKYFSKSIAPPFPYKTTSLGRFYFLMAFLCNFAGCMQGEITSSENALSEQTIAKKRNFLLRCGHER